MSNRCPDAGDLIDAYFDHELDLLKSLELERHLRQCASCAASLEARRALRAALRRGGVYQSMPPQLRERLSSESSAAMPGSDESPITGQAPAATRSAAARSPGLWRWGIGLAAAVLATATITWQVAPRLESVQPGFADALIADHVRSLQADHLTDVASSNRHTVKPWFTGMLDYSPPVQDLAEQGFPLIGGRLDYLQGRAVAALVYRRHKHVINVLVFPTDAATPPPPANALSVRGYNIISWRGSEGLSWCAISDVSAEDLRRLAELLKSEPASRPDEP